MFETVLVISLFLNIVLSGILSLFGFVLFKLAKALGVI